MLKQIIHKYLRHRHFWREHTFDELSQVYIAMLVRGISLGMTGLFIPVFLLSIGYSLTKILVIICIYFVTRTFVDIVAAFLVARFGPKHVLILGQLLFVTTSGLFLSLEVMHWPMVLLGAVWGASQSCAFVAFDVDFSKIKHSKHGGKELGYVEIMGRVGSVLGPLLGGVVSLVFGPQYIFAVSTVLMIGGLMPLLKTKEPVRTNQTLKYRDFPFEKILPQLPSFVAIHLENSLSIIGWPVYLALFVLPGATVFLKIGILASVSVAFAIISAHSIGRAVDGGNGRRVLRVSAIINSVLHICRIFVVTYPVSFAVGITNEVVTLGYRLPFFKAYYDQADDFPGHRIVFISIIESFSSSIKALVYGVLAVLSTQASPRATLTVVFSIAAVSSMIILSEKFKSFS